jgi:hypothetical protein
VDFDINSYFNVQSRGVNISTSLEENITLSTNTVDVEGNIKTSGDIEAPSFKNSNSSDSEVLLGGGGTKALSDFVTLNGQGNAYTGTINGAKFINGVCIGPA